MSPITTHILDTHRGCPASNVPIELRVLRDESFQVIASGRTNEDGRLPALLPKGGLSPGIYQMFFDTKQYHQSLGIKGFYPYVEVTFEIVNTEQPTCPTIDKSLGFSTYRGSWEWDYLRVPIRDFVVLYINGQKVTVNDERFFMPLANFLRYEREKTGTKIVCAEETVARVRVVRFSTKRG